MQINMISIDGSFTEHLTELDSRELACISRLPSMLVINDGGSDTERPNEVKFIRITKVHPTTVH